MSKLALNSVGFSAHDYAGFDLPTFGTRTRVLSDGSGDGNEVYQTGSVPRAQATFSGTMRSIEDVETLRAYNASKEIVQFVDWLGTAYSVVVDDFAASTSAPGLVWTYTMALIAVGPAVGS